MKIDRKGPEYCTFDVTLLLNKNDFLNQLGVKVVQNLILNKVISSKLSYHLPLERYLTGPYLSQDYGTIFFYLKNKKCCKCRDLFNKIKIQG